MTKRKGAGTRPPIHMIDTEADRLAELALKAEARSPLASELLLRETDRATLHKAAAMPADVVTMGAAVEFRDEGTGAARTVTLVYPPDADIAQGRVSILTPVGAGLIGMRPGQSILWPDRDGHERRLTVVAVHRPEPDAGGHAGAR